MCPKNSLSKKSKVKLDKITKALPGFGVPYEVTFFPLKLAGTGYECTKNTEPSILDAILTLPSGQVKVISDIEKVLSILWIKVVIIKVPLDKIPKELREDGKMRKYRWKFLFVGASSLYGSVWILKDVDANADTRMILYLNGEKCHQSVHSIAQDGILTLKKESK